MTGLTHEVVGGDAASTRSWTRADRRRRRIGCSITVPSRPAPLTPEALAAVLTALEGKRRSHAFHAAVLERFPGAMPFRLTVEAEARQVAALEGVLRRRDLAVPSVGAEGATTHRRVPSTLEAACLEAATAKQESVRVFERVLVPLVAGIADVERVFACIVEAARARHLPVLRHWAGDHRREDARGEWI